MKPASPATASASSSRESYSHHSASIMTRALGSLSADVDLLVAEPCGDRGAARVERWPELPALHDQGAGPRVDRRISERSHDVAPARTPVRFDAQPQVDHAAARPAALDRRRIIAPVDPA